MATFFLNIYRFLFQAAEKILLRLGALHKRKMKSGLLFKELYIYYFVDYDIETFKLICSFEVFITTSQKSENIQHNWRQVWSGWKLCSQHPIFSINERIHALFFIYLEQELAVISKLGRNMSKIPLLPRFSKMLLLANQQSESISQYVIAIVAALTVKVIILLVYFLIDENRVQNYFQFFFLFY